MLGAGVSLLHSCTGCDDEVKMADLSKSNPGPEIESRRAAPDSVFGIVYCSLQFTYQHLHVYFPHSNTVEPQNGGEVYIKCVIFPG